MDYRSLPRQDLLWTHGFNKSGACAFSINLPTQLHYYKTHVAKASSINLWRQESLTTGSISCAWKLQSSLLLPSSSQNSCLFLLCIQYGLLVAPALLNLGKRSVPAEWSVAVIWPTSSSVTGRRIKQVFVYSQHVNQDLMVPWNTSSCTVLLSQWPGPSFTNYAAL